MFKIKTCSHESYNFEQRKRKLGKISRMFFINGTNALEIESRIDFFKSKVRQLSNKKATTFKNDILEIPSCIK
jgi:hypothetical protein